MLLNLHVKNLALIDEVEVDFFDHLNILTGETGAGKSILIGSIEAALGGKCTKDMIRQDAEYALIELLFQVEHDSVKEALKQRDIFLEEGQVMITRKILPTRSVCRINGETVNLQTLREVASLLLDLHGQQENLVLKNAASQLELLDQYIGAPIKGLKEVCRQQYHTYEALRQEYEQYENRGEEVLRELRFMEYEVKEIREAALKEGEDEQLEQQYKKQANAQKVRQALSAVHAMMDAGEQANVTSLLGQCIREMNGIEDVDRTTKSLYEQLGQLDALLGDFNRELSDYMADMTYDEKEFMEITARLDEINRLKTKYGNSIEKILAYAAQKEEELLKYQDLDAYRENLKKDYDAAKEVLLNTCEQLSIKRKDGAIRMAEQIREVLVDLNFLQVEFEIRTAKTEKLTAAGQDEITFLIAANPGMPLRPIAQVASGGELSRIMLAMKSVLADCDETETLIFDEIDTGVSGRTAQKVAEKLSVISARHQVICITHLPQIAAMADTHFLIAKEMEEHSTKTVMKMLYEEESVRELARLLSGAEITDAVLLNAREMKRLAAAQKKEL